MNASRHEESVCLSVIVIAFGPDHLLRECLRSLITAAQTFAESTEILVVLNRVSPVARRRLETTHPEIRFVDPGRNLGFAGGVRVVLEHSHGEWLALFNDDCVVEPAALTQLVRAGNSADDVGSVAANVLFIGPEATINSAGIEVDALGIAYERRLGEPAAAGETTTVDVFGASGAAGLYRRSMLEAVGGFDESFFAYLEDADIAWRAQMHGWRCVYAPGAVVHHHHSASFGHRSSEKYFLVGRNRVRMLAKNASRSQLLRYGIAMVLYDLCYVAFVAARLRSLAPLRGRLRGLREWRIYRTAGESQRRRTRLAPSRGIRGALLRDQAYGRT